MVALVFGRMRIAFVVETGREKGIATACAGARLETAFGAGAGTRPSSTRVALPANAPDAGFETDKPQPGTVTCRSVAPPAGGMAKPWQKNSSIFLLAAT